MNKTTTILLVLFFVLGTGTAWYLSRDVAGSKTSMSLEGDWNFAIKEVDKIHRIFFADREGRTVDLKRKGKTTKDWIYNDTYPARQSAIVNLLDVARNIHLKYRPPGAAIPHMITDLATRAIKVELYDKAGELLKAYYVGGSTADERGTYMIMEDSENPYVMHIPYWEGNVRMRYFFGDDEWRDKTIFKEKGSDISKVSIEYPQQKNKSFIIEKKGKAYDVRPFYDVTTPVSKAVNQETVKAYFDLYKSIGAEGFENTNPNRDSLTSTIPFCIVELTKNNGDQKRLSIHALTPRNAREGKDPIIERYMARDHKNDVYLIQHHVFKKIFWAYDYFF